MKRQTMVESDFYCTECGNKGIPLPRSKNRQRAYGHIKDLYCCQCRKITKHKEQRCMDWLEAGLIFYSDRKGRVCI